MNRKGFTLVELLATILIIGLVLGLTAYGIISSVNSAKDTGETLSLSGVKEAARTYSNEAEENRWKKSNINNYTYFCVTTEELINKGLLDKKASKIENGDIKLNDYIVVIKDYTTKVIKREEVLNTSRLDEITKDAYGYCTGSIKPENIIKDVSLKDSTSKTDKIEVNYIDAEFKTDNEVNKINEVSCLYGDNTQVIEENTGVTIDKTNKKCKITGLKQSTPYYVQVCMTSENGSKSCSTPKSVNTKTIKESNININNNNSIKIIYDDTNITTGEASYYFKSNVKGESAQSVLSCTLNEGIYTCSDSTTSINENAWYRTTDKEVILTYKDSGNVTVTAETRDKSNNKTSINKTFSLYKIKYDVNGGNEMYITSQYKQKDVDLTLLKDKPTKKGYKFTGWNTSSNGTGTSYAAGGTYTENSSVTLYAQWTPNNYTLNLNKGTGVSTIYYKINGATSYSKTTNSSITLSVTYGTTYYYYGESSSGYTMKLCTSLEPCDGTKSASTETKTLSATINKVYIKFNVNGGEVTPKGDTYTTDNSGIISKNGNNIFHKINYGSSIGKNGLANYNNKDYLYITKTDYRGVPKAEWKCLSGNCTKSTYDQADTTYKASDFCDASNDDCTVVLGVNWEVYDEIKDYRCKTGVKDSYYITYCTIDECEYSGSYIDGKCNTESGTIKRDELAVDYCEEESIYDNRCSGDQKNKYYITTCNGAICKYTTKNGSPSSGEIIRCSLAKCDSSSGGGGSSIDECHCRYREVRVPYVGGFSTSNICSSTTKVCNNTQKKYVDCETETEGEGENRKSYTYYKEYYYHCETN